MIHRYESYVRCESDRKRYVFDVLKVDKDVLDSLYDYIENEFEYVAEYPKILEDHPETREIKPRGENYMSGIFKEVRAFFNWAYKNKIIDTFPFEGFEMPSERYGSPIYPIRLIWQFKETSLSSNVISAVVLATCYALRKETLSTELLNIFLQRQLRRMLELWLFL